MKRRSKAKLDQSIGQHDEELKTNPYALRRMRQAMDGIKLPKVRGRSVAAFALLPQFRMCFEGLSHLYPAFLRMIATLFSEARLIPPSHPVMKDGSVESRKYSFRKLLGEVWFRLKTDKRASAYQWGVFGAIVMVVTAGITACGAVFMRFVLGAGSVAHAQIFNAFQNTTADPYGLGEAESCKTAIQGCSGAGGVQNISGASGLFDQRVQGGGISADYALMVLDKVLRQAMADTPTGGSFQNALGGLMMVYNTGMTVIACIMIGWMVMSIIIDTAKTGTVGGGRHNMVWVPIRVLFALGIMFPIGATGFSGGQYMVVRLAEWGSNFGSKAWNQYLLTAVGNQQMLSPYYVKNVASLAQGVAKIMVCQVAYNTYLQQRTGGLAADQIIQMQQDAVNQGSTVFVTNRYTNNTGPNLCGIIKYGSNASPDDNTQALQFNPATPSMVASTSTTLNAVPDNVYRNVSMSNAISTFRSQMRNALEAALQDLPTSPPVGAGVGSAIQTARNFACRFVAQRWADGDESTVGGEVNPVSAIPNCAGVLPGNAATGVEPTAAHVESIHTSLRNATMAAFTGARPALANYISAGPMMAEMTQRGWAGMALWFKDISAMNNVLLSARQPIGQMEGGGLWMGSGSGTNTLCAGDSGEGGEQCKLSGIEERVMSIMGDYDRWWAATVIEGGPGVNPAGGGATANERMGNLVNGSPGGFFSWLNNISIGDNGLVTMLGRLIVPASPGGDAFLFKAVDMASTNTYPLAQLAETGHTVLGLGAIIWATLTIVQTLSTVEGGGFSLGKGLAMSALVNLLASMGSGMILAGIMISFYLPVLPFIRVAFAVMTWIISVFEAVVMVPVAALTHLSTVGPGLMGNYGRAAWTLWFNVFMRPILVVFGFIGGLLIFNAFSVYFHTAFTQGASAVLASNWYPMQLVGKFFYSVIYLGALYTAANTSFKMLDVLPNGMMRWLGDWGARGDVSLTQMNVGTGLGFAGASLVKQLQHDIPTNSQISYANRIMSDATKRELLHRAGAMYDDRDKAGNNLDATRREQKAKDQALTLMRMSGEDKARWQNMNSQRDKDRFLQHMFLEQENARYKRFGFDRDIGSSATGMKDPSRQGNFTLNKNLIGFIGVNTAFGNDVIGMGRTGRRRDAFVELDGGLGRGQLAGVSVTDKQLDAAIDSANRTRTSHWDDMSYAQREIVMRKVESTMSSADALNYVRMSAEDRMEFVQSMYLAMPEHYAPGIGSAGTEELLEILKNPDLMNDPDKAKRAGLMRTWMTTEDRADLARNYQKWLSQTGRSSLEMGQMASAAIGDHDIDALLSGGEMPEHRKDKPTGFNEAKDEKDKEMADLEAGAERQRQLYAKMSHEEAQIYDKMDDAKKAEFEKIIEEKAKLEKSYNRDDISQEEYRKQLTDFRKKLAESYGVNYLGGYKPLI